MAVHLIAALVLSLAQKGHFKKSHSDFIACKNQLFLPQGRPQGLLGRATPFPAMAAGLLWQQGHGYQEKERETFPSALTLSNF